MVNYYVNKIQKGLMTIDEVPAYWKDKVQAKLNEE